MPSTTKTRAAVRTDAQATRVAKAKRSTITLPEVEQHITQTLAEYGGTGTLMDAHKALEETSRTTERGLRAWYPVALEARAAGMTVRSFGDLSGGSKDTLSRLARGAAIVAAFERNGSTVPAVMVQSVANRITDKQLPDLVKSIKPGRSDLLPSLVASVKAPKAVEAKADDTTGRKTGTPNKSTSNGKTADWSIDPAQYVKALEIMRRHVGALDVEEAGRTAKALRPVVTALMDSIAQAERKAKTAESAAKAKAQAEAEAKADEEAKAKAEAETRHR